MPRNRTKSVAVIGLGTFGSSVAITLCELGHEVLGIDRDMNIVDSLKDQLTAVMQLEVTSEDALREIGVPDFDACVVGRGTDLAESVTITMLLKELGAKYIVAKAMSDRQSEILRRLGADRVVFPERESGVRVAHALLTPTVLDFMDLGGRLAVEEVYAPESVCGRTLAETELRVRHNVTLLAIRRGEEMFVNPGGSDRIESGDVLILTGTREDLQGFADQ